jgi:hypothetical protein
MLNKLLSIVQVGKALDSAPLDLVHGKKDCVVPALMALDNVVGY